MSQDFGNEGKVYGSTLDLHTSLCPPLHRNALQTLSSHELRKHQLVDNQSISTSEDSPYQNLLKSSRKISLNNNVSFTHIKSPSQNYPNKIKLLN